MRGRGSTCCGQSRCCGAIAHSRDRGHEPLQRMPRDPLSRITASGARRDASRGHSRVGVGAVTTRGSPGATRCERVGELADADHQLDRRASARCATSSCSRRPRGAELEHRAEHGDALAPRPACVEQLERRARRAGVRVVGVVDQRRARRAARSSRASAARASRRSRAPRRRSTRPARARPRARAWRCAGCARRAAGPRPRAPSSSSDPRPSGVDAPTASARTSPASSPARRRVVRASARASPTSGCDAGTIATATPSDAASPRAARPRDRPVPRDAPRRPTSRPRCPARRSRAAAAPRPADSCPSRPPRRRRRRAARAASAGRR